MADEFTLTGASLRVTGTAIQALDQALDVSDYDSATAIIGALGFEGASPSVTVRIITGMSNVSDDGWVQAAIFAARTAANTWDKIEVAGLLKYIRWEVTAFAGTSATFTIQGMLRSNS